uniref:BHLH domain-containing protein n=1 Tax=Oryza rufipogon TaxID=4529 RepID=A0A0E0NG77_ORYRU
MSQEEQRHGRQLPLATSGVITFNGVPLSPLTAGVESDGDDDVVIVDACNNGKRKVVCNASGYICIDPQEWEHWILAMVVHEEQRHGRQLPLATSGVITFNGVPLSPLTAGAESDGDDDDVVIVDACNNGKRKVGDGEEEGRGSQGGDDDDDVVAVHGGGGGGGNRACMFAVRERERRRRMNDMFAGIRRLVPNLPEKGEEVRMEAQKQELQRERDRLAMEVAAAAGGAGASSSSSSAAAAAVTVAAYGPAGAVGSSSSSAAAAARANTVVPVPQRAARGATAPTPRPVAPPQAGTWPLPAPAAMPPPPPPPTGAAAVAPPPSLKTWSWGDNVVVSVLGNIGNMTVRAPLRRTGVLAMASAALKRYNITAVTSLSGTDASRTQNMFMFYTIIDMPDRQPQFVHPKVFEAMYRAAAAEIAAWINCY